MSSNFRRILPFQANLTDKKHLSEKLLKQSEVINKTNSTTFLNDSKNSLIFRRKTIHFESREESRKKKPDAKSDQLMIDVLEQNQPKDL